MSTSPLHDRPVPSSPDPTVEHPTVQDVGASEATSKLLQTNPNTRPHPPHARTFIPDFHHQAQDADPPTDENLFDADPSPFAAHEAAEHDDDVPYDEPDDPTALLPPPDFKPFFTLIEDHDTGEHIHPTVHYLFADDDPELVTNAALASLALATDPPPTGTTPSSTTTGPGNPRPTSAASSSTATTATAAAHTATVDDDTEHRCVLVDLGADGKTVTGIASLSPGWQALRTTVTPASSWGDDVRGGGTAAQTGDRGLMLRITGQQVRTPGRTGRGRGGGGGGSGGVEELEELIRGFDERLGHLDGILGTPEGAAARVEG